MSARTEEAPVADSWTRYLGEMGTVALLEPEQVSELAHRIEVGVLARERLATRPDSPTDASLTTDLRALVAQGEMAYTQLVSANLRLVVAVARRARRHAVPLADLVQEGALGLMRAVEKYDHRRGIAFSTYATWWIRQAVNRAVAEQSRPVRVPVHVHDEVKACVRARDQISDRTGREPSAADVARLSGVDPARVSVLLRAATPAASLQQTASGTSLDGALAADLVDPVDSVAAAEAHDLLDSALHRLPVKHREVIAALVGWYDGQPRSRRAVAETTGLSRDVVQRLENEARTLLRSMPMLAGLDTFDC